MEVAELIYWGYDWNLNMGFKPVDYIQIAILFFPLLTAVVKLLDIDTCEMCS